MKSKYHYSTVIKALEELHSDGFTFDYNLHEDEIINNPNGFKITAIYQYEGDTNPDDEAIVYGIESNLGKKGVFVSGSAANSNNEAANVLNRVNIENDK
jgi:hypothetical protein